jgi:hypothetical protein
MGQVAAAAAKALLFSPGGAAPGPTGAPAAPEPIVTPQAAIAAQEEVNRKIAAAREAELAATKQITTEVERKNELEAQSAGLIDKSSTELENMRKAFHEINQEIPKTQ